MPIRTKPPSGNGALLERESEVDAIRDAIALARQGEGGALLIEGSAGIGKTTLMRWTAEHGASEGLQVLAGTGRQMERAFAFGLAHQLFEPALANLEAGQRAAMLTGAAAPLEALFAKPGTAAPVPDQAFAIIHGLYWLAVNLTELGPVVLLADDVHWGDLPSLQALAYLTPRANELPLLVVMARRTGEPGAEKLQWLRPADHLAILRPAGLSADASAKVVRAIVGAHASTELCAACQASTGGNPFLLRELARTIAAEGLDRDDTGVERVAELGPESVSKATLARIQALEPGGRALVQALAVLERSELKDAAALAQLDEADAAETAAALTEAGVVAGELPLRFAHPVLRSAVYTDLAPPVRERAHRQAARLLADTGADPDSVASHLLETERRGEEWAAEALREAARQALARGAPAIAERLLERALEESAPAPDRSALLVELGYAHLLAANPKTLEVLREAAETSDDPVIRARALAALGTFWVMIADLKAGAEAARRGIAELAGRDEPELELRLVAPHAYVAWSDASVGDTLAQGFGGADSDEWSTADSARAVGLAWFRLGRCERAEHLVPLARRGAGDERLNAIGLDGFMIRTAAAAALSFAGHPEEALKIHDELLTHARERGSPMMVAASRELRSLCLWLDQGLLPEALAEVDVVLQAKFPWEGHAAWGHLMRAEILTERDDLTGAGAALAKAEEILARARHYQGDVWLPAVRSRLALARGDAKAALSEALESGERWLGIAMGIPAWSPWRSRAALAAARLGDLDRARELCAEELRLARQGGIPRAICVALRASAAIEPGGEATERLREAVEITRSSPALLEHAKALVDLGSALRRAGQRRDAAPPLREGMGLAQRCGATATVERAGDELKTLGARPRRMLVSGRESLTPSELRVCELAAKSLNNREIAERLFVTRRTVETHLTHAYAKLEIEGRGQLAVALAGDVAERR